MKIVNKSSNTIFLDGINKYIPFDDNIYELSATEVLRSQGLQTLVLLDQIEVIEFGESRIEQNLKNMVEKMSKLKLLKKSVNVSKKTEEDPVKITAKPSVFIKGHFLEGGGYAKANSNLVRGLSNKNIPVKLQVIGSKKDIMPNSDLILKLQGQPNKYDIKIDSMIPTFSNMTAGSNSILYTTIEANTVPQQFIDISKNYERIWVTSNFCKEVLEKYDLDRRIDIIPNSIDTDLYQEEGDVFDFRPSLRSFVFVSVFGWSYRKGYDVLLKSYLRAFSNHDDVSLLIVSKCSTGQDVVKNTIDRYLSDYGSNAAHVSRCSRFIPEEHMPSLYRACDAYVMFSRGEGFGYPYCESSLCGLPVVATDCSGHSMFLNKDNSTLIDIDKYVKIPKNTMHVHYWDDQEFPALTSERVIEQAAFAMRDVYENYDKAVEKNRKLQNHILSNYTIEAVADKVSENLNLRD